VNYVDASAVLRVLFHEAGPSVSFSAGGPFASSQIVVVETHRAVDRARLLGLLDDHETATKRSELAELLAMMDLATVDDTVIARAKTAFAVNVRALDAIHIATAEILAAEVNDEVLEFWTHDERQGTAALSRGLAVRGMS